MCLISYVGYSCVYTMAPYLVYPAEAGGHGPFYDGVYKAGAYGQGGFLPHGWRCDLRIGSTAP